MEVILNSEIARLVLGYLKDQNLEKAHRKFCQTSKYLKDEYELLCRGYQPVSVSNSNLIEIIKEYCEIKSQVNQFINLFSNEISDNIQSQPNLIKRVEFILSKAKREIVRHADDSYSAKRKTVKRKRSVSVETTSSETEYTINDYVRPAPHNKNNSKMFKLHSTSIGYTLLSSKDNNTNGTPRRSNIEICDDTDNLSRSLADDMTAFKETLLENTEFQTKLAENINKALNCNSTTVDKNAEEPSGDNTNENPVQIQFDINDAINNIICTVEQDPIFDNIVQDVVNHQKFTYDTNLAVVATSSGETEETIPNQENLDGESMRLLRKSTPKKKCNLKYDDTITIHNSGNDTFQPKINNTEIELVTEKYDTIRNAFVISNEPFHAEIVPNSHNAGNSTSHLIITPNSMSTLSHQQNNQSNVIFINDSNFNSGIQSSIINLNNTTTNQFPFLMSSSMLTESTNVSMPFLMNSSPCVPIATSQFPGNFMAQPTPQYSAAPLRKGRPRKILASTQQNATVTSTQPNQCQINQPTVEINTNTITTTHHHINPISSVVTSSSNSLTLQVTSAHNSTSNNVIYSQATLDEQSVTAVEETNKDITVIENNSEDQPIITILNSKIEIPENTTNINEPETALNYELFEINMPNVLPINDEPTVNEIKAPIADEELPPVEATKTVLAIDKMQMATPKQNMKPFENLKVKSNSTPRRKSHVRILDFTTPGRSGIVSQQVPKTIERSIHLNSIKGSRIMKLQRLGSHKKVEKRNETKNDDGITTTPKVKKSAHKCVRVLSRSASDENCGKENENTETTNSEQIINTDPADGSIKSGDVKLSLNLSPMDEWKQMRNVSQTNKWDSYLRFVSAVENVSKAKKEKTEQLARRKLQKLKLMKERRQNNMALKRIKKPIRKSPRLQKQQKGRVLNESQKLVQTESNDTIEPKTTEQSVKSITESKEGNKIEEPISEIVTKTLIDVKQNIKPIVESTKKGVSSINPLQRSTHSMACLLETPFKADVELVNPVTPLFLPPLAVEDTPMTKILKSLNKQLGSDLKNDIFTPNFAITPGCNLTPPKALDKMTPQSGSYPNRPTDYSSGSSYYRPDESDDKIESLAIRNKSSVHEFEYEVTSTKIGQIEKIETSKMTDEVEVPVALETVKLGENINSENTISLYTFNELDENIEIVETDPKDNDTSSSSSCSCSSSSSSSSSSSDSSNASFYQKTELTTNKTIDERCEIRHPIRAWKTPNKFKTLEKKLDEFKSSTSALKLSDQQTVLKELEEKRIRMRDKIKLTESNEIKTKNPKHSVKNLKSKRSMNPRQTAKQTVPSSRPSTSSSMVQAEEKIKAPRKNPTPKKLIPLKNNKSHSSSSQSLKKHVKNDSNGVMLTVASVKPNKQMSKISDRGSIKSEDMDIAKEFKNVYQNNVSESEDDDDDEECKLVLQSDIINFTYNEKSSVQIKANENMNEMKGYLQSSKSVMNVDIEGRKIQIKANELMSIYECAPSKHHSSSKSNLNRPKNNGLLSKTPESQKFHSKLKSNRKENNESNTSTKSSGRNDIKCMNRPTQSSTAIEKIVKNEKLSANIMPRSPENTRNTSLSNIMKAQFHLKYKTPKKHKITTKSSKKSVPSRNGSSTTVAKDVVEFRKSETQELKQSHKISSKVDKNTKLKPSSSDTINAVLAHLHGTE